MATTLPTNKERSRASKPRGSTTSIRAEREQSAHLRYEHCQDTLPLEAAGLSIVGSEGPNHVPTASATRNESNSPALTQRKWASSACSDRPNGWLEGPKMCRGVPALLWCARRDSTAKNKEEWVGGSSNQPSLSTKKTK